MKLFITGAGGFLGKYVTSVAVNQGQSVRALVRPASKNIPDSWLNNPVIEIVKGDLRNKKIVPELISGCDVVVHLAATKAGDLYEQFGGTVIATENLLAGMEEAGLSKIVLISSFSVYEYLKRRTGYLVNEDSPLAYEPSLRDEYCQTKLLQECITVKCAEKNKWTCTVLRPGVIFGHNNLWTARLGSQSSEKKWLSIGRFARLPLTYVENTAEAVIKCVDFVGSENVTVFNVVDDASPSQGKYLNFLIKNMEVKPKVTRLPWMLMRFLARCASIFNHIFLNGKGKIPGLFVPERLHARCKPFRYTNKKIKTELGWQPRYSWEEGVTRSKATAAGAE